MRQWLEKAAVKVIDTWGDAFNDYARGENARISVFVGLFAIACIAVVFYIMWVIADEFQKVMVNTPKGGIGNEAVA